MAIGPDNSLYLAGLHQDAINGMTLARVPGVLLRQVGKETKSCRAE